MPISVKGDKLKTRFRSATAFKVNGRLVFWNKVPFLGEMAAYSVSAVNKTSGTGPHNAGGRTKRVRVFFRGTRVVAS